MSNGLIFWISASWVIRAYIPNFSLLGDQETSGQPRNWFGRNYLLKVLVFWISGSSFWKIWHPWILAFWKWCNIYNWTCSPWSWWTPPCPCSHCPPALGLLFEKFDIPGCWHFEKLDGVCFLELCLKMPLIAVKAQSLKKSQKPRT